MSDGDITLNGGYIVGNKGYLSSDKTYGGGVRETGTACLTINGGVIAGNSADFGGGVYVRTSSDLTVTGGTISGNNAGDNGGGVYTDWKSTISMSGGPVIRENRSGSDGAERDDDVYLPFDEQAVNITGKLSDNAYVLIRGVENQKVCNLVADGYALTDDDVLRLGSDELAFKCEKEDDGVYLREDALFCHVVIDDDGKITDHRDLVPGEDYVFEADVREASKWNVTGVSEDRIIREYVDKAKTRERITIRNVNEAVKISHSADRFTNGATYLLSVILDGKMTTLAEVRNLYGYGLFDNRYYRYMRVSDTVGSDIVSALKPFGFDLEAFGEFDDKDRLVFANTNKTVYEKAYAGAAPDSDPDGGWRISFALSDDGSNVFDKCRMYYLSSPLDKEPDEALTSADLFNRGFWTVTVRDFVNEDDPEKDMSQVKYVAARGKVAFELREAEPGEWKANPGYNAGIEFDRDTRPGHVIITVSDVNSRVTLYRGESKYTRYSVQYYAYADEIDWNMANAVTKLDMIDTHSLGRLPRTGELANGGTDAALKKIGIDGEGSVITKKSDLSPIYKTRYFEYAEAPTLLHVDRLYMDPNYTLDELWIFVGDDESKTDSTDKFDGNWKVYSPDDFKGVIDDLRDLYLTSDETFANDPNFKARTILIENDSVVRFVYNTTSSEDGGGNDYSSLPVQFYDYDITNGSNILGAKDQGINRVINSNKAQLAFGNANANEDTKQVNAVLPGTFLKPNYMNRYNNNNIGGCAFGIVKDKLDGNGNIVYNDSIVAPELFDDDGGVNVTGKTTLSGYSLDFSRVGDNYTLTYVLKGGTVVGGIDGFDMTTKKYDGNLSKFSKVYDNGKSIIYSNSFWPMDNVYSYSATATYGSLYKCFSGSHDPKFGTKEVVRSNYGYTGKWPASDDGMSHNSFFGMHFDLDFTLQPDYVGNLDYCFFGDDDMWVYLDGELVLDIGGVHSSVGEYVNLWDYIKDPATGELIGKGGEFSGDFASVTEHRLSVCYDERGASGSTCWMRFTIPEAKFEDGGQFTSDKFGNLTLSKMTEGEVQDGTEEPAKYSFHIDLKDGAGNELHDYTYTIMSGGLQSEGLYLERGHLDVELAPGDQVTINNIPVGTRFEITEEAGDAYVTSFQVNGETQRGGAAAGMIVAGSNAEVVCTNMFVKTGFEMPRTGGTGTVPFMVAGTMFMLAGLLPVMGRWKRR